FRSLIGSLFTLIAAIFCDFFVTLTVSGHKITTKKRNKQINKVKNKKKMRIAPILQSSAFIGVSFILFVSCLTFQIYALLSNTEFTEYIV
ncbi:MAG: hypothetical protein IJQ95_00920, partial [Paludibacteraceae bacterium]|nr:hypothetical protein [Paludibacteraceae bacterium]